LLDETFRQVAARAPTNPDLRIETVEGKSELVVTPLDKIVDCESLRFLRASVQSRLPKVGMPDVLLEAMARTGFAQAFTHLSERQARVEHFDISLCAALIGEACNIGLEPMVREDIPALRRDRLSWIGQNFIRPETLDAASALIVATHGKLPLVQHWGSGEVASADGMRFVAPASAIHAGPNPKYYGQARGVTWYNMLSNQFSGLNGAVVPGTLRDSLVILALLLEQETELDPQEIMTDTAAYSDAIFGLFWLLGYQFSPRLADIGGAKLWRIDRAADYGPFQDIAKSAINLNLIRDNWSDLIRLAGSLKLGHLKAAGIMRTLQIKDRPTTLARALSELGRIVKTIHILRYVDNSAFRRRILIQLNRQELRHRLGRRVHHGERGEIRSPLRQGQEEQLGALGLALNSIADQIDFDSAASDRIERPVARLAVDTPEFDAADVRQAGAELVSEEPEQAENGIGISGGVCHNLQRFQLGFLLQQESQDDQAVAQRSGDDGAGQTAELIGNHVVPSEAAFLAVVFGIGTGVYGARRSDETHAVRAGYLAGPPVTDDIQPTVRGNDRGVGCGYGLGSNEILI